MTGSPFSNVLSSNTSDTTTETTGRPADTSSEPSFGVETSPTGTTHESGQDETPGDASSGEYTAGS